VLTIKPGMVATPMTAHMKQGLLFSTPEKVGRDIYRAIIKKKDVLYTPGYWRWAMVLIKAIPECLFKRLSL
jgi:short-subunit dehydrogenase